MTSEVPSKPSRSEIESALSGRTAVVPPKHTGRAQTPDFNFEASPRRQQVIGGDLTGVTKRKKTGIFSRYAEISIANWVAGLLVILIIAAFFWPRDSDSIKEVSDRANKIQSPSIYTESRLDDEAAPEFKTQNFSRDTDLDRAGDFREADAQELQIRKLIVAAEAFIAKGAYTQPDKANAVVAYQSILKIDPRNVEAKQGLDYINSRFLGAGNQAISDGNLTLAQTSLDRLASISVDSDQYIELSAALENWKIQTKIDDLLDKASAAMKAEKLILPARENSLFYYQQAQILDEANQDAKEGINDIANIFIDRANNELLQGRYEAATGYLATVSVIDPRHPSIAMLEAMITKAEPIAQRTDDANNNVAAQRPRSSTEQQSVDTQPTAPQQVSPNRTPQKEAGEQALFDKQYLDRGLAAYYRGDYDAAAALLQPLADKGVSRAQFRIGYMYYLGRGFKRDRKEADRVIRAALPAIQKFANEGRTWAQSDLGSLYEDGLVLPRDYGEAVYWYRSAAENGYPGAQTNLGIMYARGRGVTTSRRTAIEWFQRAAKQGDIVAKKNLEAMGAN
jgi:tetratricopeptide (TPR) repeat protein